MALYDTTFKELAKTGLIELVRFLMPDVAAGVELCELPAEFPATVRSADFVFKTLGGPRGPLIGLFECQVAREDKLPRLLLLRAALAHYYYDLPVSTVLLALTREAVVPPSLVYGLCEDKDLRHEFTVRRLYEEPAEPALERAAAEAEDRQQRGPLGDGLVRSPLEPLSTGPCRTVRQGEAGHRLAVRRGGWTTMEDSEIDAKAT